MENSLEKYIDQIDQYLDGKLDDASLAQMEEAIQSYPTLKEELKWHVEARRAIRIEGESKLRSEFQQMHNEASSPKMVNIKPAKSTFQLWKLAGMILLLAGAVFLLRQEQSEPVGETAYTDPSIVSLRGNENQDQTEAWRELLVAFSNKDYQSVLEMAKELPKDDTFGKDHQGKLNLIKGVSNWRLKQYEQADIHLKQILATNPYYDQAQWYQALNTLDKGDLVEALNTLKAIQNNENHYQHKKARAIINELSH